MNEDAYRAGRPGFEEIEDGLYLLKSPFATIWSGVFLVRGPLNVLIDSGCSAEVVDGVIMPALEDIGVAPEEIKWVINTHSHGDHVNGNTRLLERTGALLAAYKAVAEKLSDPLPYNRATRCTYPEYSPAPAAYIAPQEADLVLNEYDVLAGRLKIFATPGHDSCCISLLDLKTNSLIVGDSMQFLGTNENGGMELAFYKDLDAYKGSLAKIRSIGASNIFASHDYLPAGYSFKGKDEVKRAIDICEDAVATFSRNVKQLMDEGVTELPDIARGLIHMCGAEESAYLFSSMFTAAGHVEEIRRTSR